MNKLNKREYDARYYIRHKTRICRRVKAFRKKNLSTVRKCERATREARRKKAICPVCQRSRHVVIRPKQGGGCGLCCICSRSFGSRYSELTLEGLLKIRDLRKCLGKIRWEKMIARQSSQRWRDENREQVRVYQRAYSAKNAKRVLERQREWRKKNGERVRKTNRLWLKKNREKSLAVSRKWWQKNAKRLNQIRRKRYNGIR